MAEIILAIALYLSGLGTGWAVFDEQIVVQKHLQCPVVKKPDPIEMMIVRDCLRDCPKEFEVLIDRKSRSEIDRFANDCRDYQNTVDTIINGYNSKVKELAEKLEEENAKIHE